MRLYFQLFSDFVKCLKFSTKSQSLATWSSFIICTVSTSLFLLSSSKVSECRKSQLLNFRKDKINHFYIYLCVFFGMYSCPYIPLGSFEKDAFEGVEFCFYKNPCQRKYISLTCSNTSFHFFLLM